MCVYGVIAFACGRTANHWFRCADAQYYTQSAKCPDADPGAASASLCDDLRLGLTHIRAPGSMGCGFPCGGGACRGWVESHRAALRARRREAERLRESLREVKADSTYRRYPRLWSADQLHAQARIDELQREISWCEVEAQMDRSFYNAFKEALELPEAQQTGGTHQDRHLFCFRTSLAWLDMLNQTLEPMGRQLVLTGQELDTFLQSMAQYKYTYGGQRHSLEGFSVHYEHGQQQPSLSNPLAPGGGGEGGFGYAGAPAAPEIATAYGSAVSSSAGEAYSYPSSAGGAYGNYSSGAGETAPSLSDTYPVSWAADYSYDDQQQQGGGSPELVWTEEDQRLAEAATEEAWRARREEESSSNAGASGSGYGSAYAANYDNPGWGGY